MADYTTVALVRTGLQKIGEKNIDDAFIQQYVTAASSDCDLYSGKTWQSGDSYFGSIEGIALQLAIAYCQAAVEKKEVFQINGYNMAIQRLKDMNENLLKLGLITDAATLGAVQVTDTTTYPANIQGEEILAASHSIVVRKGYLVDYTN